MGSACNDQILFQRELFLFFDHKQGRREKFRAPGLVSETGPSYPLPKKKDNNNAYTCAEYHDNDYTFIRLYAFVGQVELN